MKKFLSLALSLAMVFTLAAPAGAAVEVSGNTSKNVTATYVPTVKYSVTVADAENGSVTVSAETAAAGDTVEIFVHPNSGYALDNLTVTGTGGNVDVADNHTFEMPAYDVTVTATFKATTVTYTVNIGTFEGGSVSVDPTEFAAGTDVTLVVKPDDGYELGSLTVTNDTTGAELHVTDSNTFVMPASNVTVTATFVEEIVPVYYDVVISGITNGSVVTNKDEATEGEKVTLTVTAHDGFELESLTVNGQNVTDEVVNGKYTFEMPAYDVTVTATFAVKIEDVTSAEISWGAMTFVYTDGEGWDDDGTGWVTVENTGNTTITASAEYEAAEGYTEITGTISPASKELNGGDDTTFTLTLSGQPAAAIPAGTKIGEVTVTLE